MDVLAGHYANGCEDTRLIRSGHGRLEYLRTQELVRRHIRRPPARIADVGGGTGVHARWLANDGFAVHVIDPVDVHVAMSATIPGVTAELGDARELAHPDDSFDAVLLLGPLYHLVGAGDRQRALRECKRVLRPQGLLVAAAISRYMSLLENGLNGPLAEQTVRSIESVMRTGEHDGHVGFVESHAHTGDELRKEVEASGFDDVTVYGVEGPVWATLDAIGATPGSSAEDAALRSARLVEQDSRVMDVSAHLLAVCRA